MPIPLNYRLYGHILQQQVRGFRAEYPFIEISLQVAPGHTLHNPLKVLKRGWLSLIFLQEVSNNATECVIPDRLVQNVEGPCSFQVGVLPDVVLTVLRNRDGNGPRVSNSGADERSSLALQVIAVRLLTR